MLKLASKLETLQFIIKNLTKTQDYYRNPINSNL